MSEISYATNTNVVPSGPGWYVIEANTIEGVRHVYKTPIVAWHIVSEVLTDERNNPKTSYVEVTLITAKGHIEDDFEWIMSPDGLVCGFWGGMNFGSMQEWLDHYEEEESE